MHRCYKIFNKIVKNRYMRNPSAYSLVLNYSFKKYCSFLDAILPEKKVVFSDTNNHAIYSMFANSRMF